MMMMLMISAANVATANDIATTIATTAATTTTTTTREHWIQCITFAIETNAADTHSVTDGRRATQYLLRSLTLCTDTNQD